MRDIGQSTGKTKEIEKGNYQDRYAHTIIGMKEEELTVDAINKKMRKAGLDIMSESEVLAIRGVHKKFNSYYNPSEIAKRKEQEGNKQKQEKTNEEEKIETTKKREKLTNEEYEKKYKDYV